MVLYCRISKGDEEKAESNSIANQKIFCRKLHDHMAISTHIFMLMMLSASIDEDRLEKADWSAD